MMIIIKSKAKKEEDKDGGYNQFQVVMTQKYQSLALLSLNLVIFLPSHMHAPT